MMTQSVAEEPMTEEQEAELREAAEAIFTAIEPFDAQLAPAACLWVAGEMLAALAMINNVDLDGLIEEACHALWQHALERREDVKLLVKAPAGSA